jgi:hypothetical protein
VPRSHQEHATCSVSSTYSGPELWVRQLKIPQFSHRRDQDFTNGKKRNSFSACDDPLGQPSGASIVACSNHSRHCLPILEAYEHLQHRQNQRAFASEERQVCQFLTTHNTRYATHKAAGHWLYTQSCTVSEPRICKQKRSSKARRE